MTPPKVLYKYKAFDSLTLDLLVADRVYCANPADFNDPLDTKPCVKPDLPVADLENVLRVLIERRTSSEMRAAANSIKYRGPKTVEHIDRHSRRQAEIVLSEISYHATNPDYSKPTPEPQIDLLGHAIEREVLRVYEKGVLSLAERFDCPLMWSHYGNQHNGICIGYKIPADAKLNIFKVKYGGSREIEASKIMCMLDDAPGAQVEVDSAVFLRKAYDWKYEKEWRFIGSRGLMDSPFELAEITFGSRCLDSVKFTLLKALESRLADVAFYEIREKYGTFKLKRYRLNVDELSASYPRNNQAILSCFDD